jgi:hypothetical protein
LRAAALALKPVVRDRQVSSASFLNKEKATTKDTIVLASNIAKTLEYRKSVMNGSVSKVIKRRNCDSEDEPISSDSDSESSDD